MRHSLPWLIIVDKEWGCQAAASWFFLMSCHQHLAGSLSLQADNDTSPQQISSRTQPSHWRGSSWALAVQSSAGVTFLGASQICRVMTAPRVRQGSCNNALQGCPSLVGFVSPLLCTHTLLEISGGRSKDGWLQTGRVSYLLVAINAIETPKWKDAEGMKLLSMSIWGLGIPHRIIHILLTCVISRRTSGRLLGYLAMLG